MSSWVLALVILQLNLNSQMNEARDRAGVLVRKLMPSFFFCFRNEYDEVSTAVFPFATDFLAFYKKYFHARGETPPAEFVVLIPELLNAIIEKMKFDESTNWGDEDELTDEAEFHDMRKRLKILQDSLAVIDPGLVLQTLVNLVGGAFDKFSQGGSSRVDWREMDLAMYEMNAIGDLAYQDSSVYVKAENGNRMNMKAGLNSTAPAPAALFAVVTKMVESSMSPYVIEDISICGLTVVCVDVATYPHPAILLQYMEIANRFQNVIEAHKELIPRALETFVRGTHASHNRVRTRSWYLFQRFVKKMRPHIGDIAEGVIGAVSDLLKIKAEIPEDGDDEMSSDDLNKHDATFDSQLYLFEAVGSLSSTNTIPQEKQIALAREMMNPLFADIERHLPVAQGGSMQAIFQIHHDILALGTLARGFSDWAPGVTKTAASAPTEIVRNEFQRVAEAVLVCLERLNTYENIRDAARFAFARLVGVLGSSILPLLPRWINGLLGRSSNMGEIQLFLRLLVQVIHGFKVRYHAETLRDNQLIKSRPRYLRS